MLSRFVSITFRQGSTDFVIAARRSNAVSLRLAGKIGQWKCAAYKSGRDVSTGSRGRVVRGDTLGYGHTGLVSFAQHGGEPKARPIPVHVHMQNLPVLKVRDEIRGACFKVQLHFVDQHEVRSGNSL